MDMYITFEDSVEIMKTVADYEAVEDYILLHIINTRKHFKKSKRRSENNDDVCKCKR